MEPALQAAPPLPPVCGVQPRIPEAQRALVFVHADEEYAPVTGAPPFYVPSPPSAAADSLMLLHTQVRQGRRVGRPMGSEGWGRRSSGG